MPPLSLTVGPARMLMSPPAAIPVTLAVTVTVAIGVMMGLAALSPLAAVLAAPLTPTVSRRVMPPLKA